MYSNTQEMIIDSYYAKCNQVNALEPLEMNDAYSYTVRFYTSLDQENEEMHHVQTFSLYPTIEDMEYLKQESVIVVTQSYNLSSTQ